MAVVSHIKVITKYLAINRSVCQVWTRSACTLNGNRPNLSGVPNFSKLNAERYCRKCSASYIICGNHCQSRNIHTFLFGKKSFTNHTLNLVKKKILNYPLKRNTRMHYATGPKLPFNMNAWKVYEYGSIDSMPFMSECQIPAIIAPDEVLIEVHAASVNQLDIKMLAGYGATVLNMLRKKRGYLNNGSEFPLILGQDYSGVVVGTGKAKSRFKIGDEVWGTVDSSNPRGSFAEYTVQPAHCLSLKPPSLSHVEAASIPYVACTTWSALCKFTCFGPHNMPCMRVLVFGGSGGVGTFAIQLLKAWGAEVTTTCSTDAVDLVTSLGADNIIDYKTMNVEDELAKLKGFDLVFDCVGGENHIIGPQFLRTGGTFVTIQHPFLHNIDIDGIPIGFAKSAMSFVGNVAYGLTTGKRVLWSFYFPSVKCLDTCRDLISDRMIIPVIDKVYPFIDLPGAMEDVSGRGNRGKMVISVKVPQQDKPANSEEI